MYNFPRAGAGGTGVYDRDGWWALLDELIMLSLESLEDCTLSFQTRKFIILRAKFNILRANFASELFKFNILRAKFASELCFVFEEARDQILMKNK